MLKIITNFLTGQVIIKVVNSLLVASAILILDIKNFAIYSFGLTILTIMPTLINLGSSRYLNTYGSKENNNENLSYLYNLCKEFTLKNLYVLAPIALLYCIFAYRQNLNLDYLSIFVLILLICLGCWLQNLILLKQSLCNINQDQNTLFLAGLSGSLTRFLVLVPLFIWKNHLIMFFGNICSLLTTYYVLEKRTKIYYWKKNKFKYNKTNNKDLSKFIKPLIPTIIYFAFQNQISTFVLLSKGEIISLAGLGALEKINQLLSILIMVNPFYVQPLFAKISSKKLFIKKTIIIISGLILFSSVMVSFSGFYPSLITRVLGSKYSYLNPLYPFSILSICINLIASTFFTILLARSYTKNQTWYVLLGITSQILFINHFGISSLKDALIFNLVAPTCYLVIQFFSFCKYLRLPTKAFNNF